MSHGNSPLARNAPSLKSNKQRMNLVIKNLTESASKRIGEFLEKQRREVARQKKVQEQRKYVTEKT